MEIDIQIAESLIEAFDHEETGILLWDKNDKKLMEPKVNTMPYLRLLEACALIKIHNKLAFSGFDKEGNMIELPEKYTKYLKYTKEAGEKFAN